MTPSVCSILLTAALGANPVPPAPTQTSAVVVDASTDVSISHSVPVPAAGPVAAAECGCAESRNSFDAQYPWAHGYFQEISEYEGFHAFRPYNYKHVLLQSQLATGWGMSPTSPYSQQFWQKYQPQAAMQPSLVQGRPPRSAGQFASARQPQSIVIIPVNKRTARPNFEQPVQRPVMPVASFVPQPVEKSNAPASGAGKNEAISDTIEQWPHSVVAPER